MATQFIKIALLIFTLKVNPFVSITTHTLKKCLKLVTWVIQKDDEAMISMQFDKTFVSVLNEHEPMW